MPKPVTVISVNPEEWSALTRALQFSYEFCLLPRVFPAAKIEDWPENLDPFFGERVKALARRIGKKKIHKDGRDRTPIELLPGEYETVMEALECYSTSAPYKRPVVERDRIFNLWIRLLFEGGHVTRKEIEELEKKHEEALEFREKHYPGRP